jgi:hypothetical protein
MESTPAEICVEIFAGYFRRYESYRFGPSVPEVKLIVSRLRSFLSFHTSFSQLSWYRICWAPHFLR